MLVQIKNLIENYHGWSHIFILLSVAAVVHLALLLCYKIASHRLILARFIWSRVFLAALRRPLIALIWFLTISYLIFFMTDFLLDASGREWSQKIISVGISVIFLWFCLRYIREVEHKMLHGEIGSQKYDKMTLDGIAKLARIAVVTLTILMILQEGFNVSMAAIYAAAGGIGVGLTFAAQDLLKNFFGGLVLYFDRPFSIGDWISSPDREIEGTVEKIGWRTTRILTLSRRPLYVPNAIFLTVIVENPQRMLNRRIKQIIGISFEDYKVIPQILSDIKALLRQHPDLDQAAAQYINVMELASSSINLQLYAFTKTTNQLVFQDIQQDLLLTVLAIIEKHGAKTAFPTTALHLPAAVSFIESTK